MGYLGQLDCHTLECGWKTSLPLPFDNAIALLEIHIKCQHVVEFVTVESTRIEKVPRRHIKIGLGQDSFEFFKSRWRVYVRSCKITDLDILRDQLIACCDHELMVDLHRSVGAQMTDASEETLLNELERLAVEKHSNLVNINKLMMTNQDREELVKGFFSHLKGIKGLLATFTNVSCAKI